MESFESKVQIELKKRREEDAERYRNMSFEEIKIEKQKAVETFFKDFDRPVKYHIPRV